MSLFHRDRNEITRSPPEAAVRARWPVPFSLCVLFGGEVVFAQVGCCVFFFYFYNKAQNHWKPSHPPASVGDARVVKNSFELSRSFDIMQRKH